MPDNDKEQLSPLFSDEELAQFLREVEELHPGITEEIRALFKMDIQRGDYHDAFWHVHARVLKFAMRHPLLNSRHDRYGSAPHHVASMIYKLAQRHRAVVHPAPRISRTPWSTTGRATLHDAEATALVPR